MECSNNKFGHSELKAVTTIEASEAIASLNIPSIIFDK
jgi:hypothetical protein